ncbi:MAG TPA: hypothetical protein VMG60_03275 [Burkholderiaceae bacterium]|nr:hypothetical protein [Burkholderiaceae bacterium]
MRRIGIRLSAAILAATATLGLLIGIATLAGLESSRNLPVVVLPMIVVTASRSEALAESCMAQATNAAEQCKEPAADVASTETPGIPLWAVAPTR